MYKTIIAGLAALSLTFTPVQGAAEGLSDRQVGQLIFGLVAAGIIAKALSDSNRRGTAATVPDRHVTPNPLPRNHVAPLRQQQPTGRNPENGRRAALPAACLSRHDTQRGVQRIFGAHCLERNYRNARSLPQQCAIRLRTYEGPREGYAPACLRDYGYQIDRRN